MARKCKLFHPARVDIARLDNAAPDQTVVSEH